MDKAILAVAMAIIGGIVSAATAQVVLPQTPMNGLASAPGPVDGLGSYAESAPASFPQMMDIPIINPGQEMTKPLPGATSEPADGGGLTHPWDLPPVTVNGVSGLREEQHVGSYGQPVWTLDRRFVETRVYVRPEGSLQFEYWFIPTIPRKGKAEIANQAELEFGLPHRLQLDLYLTSVAEGGGGQTFINEAIEFRYAFADWDKIWGNPTFYIEYTKQDQGADQLETKLLFGGDAAPRWHWGADLTYQRDFGGARTNTYETTEGISYTVNDSKFDIGGEFKLQLNDYHGSRGHLHDNIFLGPSIQYRPFPGCMLMSLP